MNILELDSYNLADAVKFNDKLNPRIWQGEKMKPQVRAKLLQIAEDFKQSLGLSDLEVKDITVSGSNAGYTYTPNSDIDLHLVVDLPQADASEVYRELFDAKKFQYNETHNITIGGYDVELYVENANQPPVSQGMYSVVKDDWINIPKKRRATVDDNAVKSKYDVMKHRIESAIASKNFKRLTNTAVKIKKMRQAGLDKHGELGPENLAYKMLRTQGTIKALYDARTAAQDKKLSLKEQPRPRVTYGFAEDVGITPDGVSPSTKMFLSETDDEQTVADFIKSTAEFLGIERLPKINLHSDPDWGEQNQSFGRYDPDSHELHVNLANRHIMDVLRTTAHELAHCRQHEIKRLPLNAGDTGSPWENEAHAVAGIVMRNYADQHPEMFQGVDLNENASGYIPKNKKEARDPRYSMAVTVDIKPGQVGKEANKLGLQTDKQGKPALLMKSANLQESLAAEFELFESGQDLFEIKMTGKNLAKLASDIKGAKVGLEFEMIVPNATVDDDGDMEPDYDQDERVRDIDDAVNFFDDGDYNGSGQIRRLRDQMYEDYWSWRSEQVDNDWWNSGQGFEYFQEYLDREDPFDEEEAEEEARNQLQSEYGDELDTEEFEKMLFALVDEKREAYAQEQWDDQGRNFDDAKEEYEEEHADDYSEQDWLESQGIRYASDVESNYGGDITWPYYTSNSSEGEADIERIALEFMNESGLPYDSVAVSSSYHGTYKKWVGNGWVSVGSEKPDDCFSIEPDGSLDGNSSSDVGLEFVSPPIPLDQVGDVMAKVQQWAAANGVYTGKNNKTSIHTNISIPGYSIENLDYLKAALLLGDEYVLRQFDRIGNAYAKPAIEKVKQIVNQKPEKAQELLDKMKSQLNAAASKLIHSGITDKFTSINTKGNRIEFRSPGGDYLSDIADNPKKMQDTINRMVVAMDAAMDPDKYKEEYQKKLYKVLTGQQSGREATSGLKREPKQDTNDLLNIFSRYAAGELPKAALKSFVRQAQTERKLAKGDTGGEKFWWNVKYNDQRMEVVAANKKEAKEVAAKEWGLTAAQADTITSSAITALRPYEEKPAATPGSGTYRITTTGGGLIAGDEYGSDEAALQRAAYWAQRRAVDVVVRNQLGQEIGRVSSSGEITPTASTANHNWAIRRRDSGEVVKTFQADDYMTAHGVLQQYKRDHNITDDSLTYGPYNREDQQPAQQQSGRYTYRVFTTDSNQTAGTFQSDGIQGSTAANIAFRNYLSSIGRDSASGFNYEEIGRERAAPQAAQAQPNQGNWGIWIIGNNRFANQPGTYARGADVPLYRFPSQEAAESWLEQQRAERAGLRTDIEVREIEPTRTPVSNINLFPELGSTSDQQQGGIVDVAGETPTQAPRTLTTPGQGQQVFTGEWKVVDPNGNEIYRFSGVGNSQADANAVAIRWLQQNPRHMQGGVEVVPVMGEA